VEWYTAVQKVWNCTQAGGVTSSGERRLIFRIHLTCRTYGGAGYGFAPQLPLEHRRILLWYHSLQPILHTTSTRLELSRSPCCTVASNCSTSDSQGLQLGKPPPPYTEGEGRVEAVGVIISQGLGSVHQQRSPLTQRAKGGSEAMGICHLTTFPIAQRAKGRGRFIIWGRGVSWGGGGRDRGHTWVSQCSFLVVDVPRPRHSLSFVVLLPSFAALPSLFVSLFLCLVLLRRCSRTLRVR
jgi:hypothetical protein